MVILRMLMVSLSPSIQMSYCYLDAASLHIFPVHFCCVTSLIDLV